MRFQRCFDQLINFLDRRFPFAADSDGQGLG